MTLLPTPAGFSAPSGISSSGDRENGIEVSGLQALTSPVIPMASLGFRNDLATSRQVPELLDRFILKVRSRLIAAATSKRRGRA